MAACPRNRSGTCSRPWTTRKGKSATSTDDVSAAADNELVKLVNKIIVDAYNQNASDIHIEPLPGKGKTGVRFRKDGSLSNYIEVPASYRQALTTRLKIMCDLDISEKRKPQDGKIKFKKFGPLDIELRVATIPTAGGVEDVVMRILAAGEPIPLDKLGVLPQNLDTLKKCVSKPYGLFFVCGPTGSGKTTTLHSVLGFLNTVDTKIWTAEDPVEITQKGLRQCQVNPKAGFTFATAMKAFLRADPDIIMVGEMRDKDTTAIGIEASLTGHLVFATLHTNSAPESIIRLLDMGMDPFNFADALLGILAQRLGKRLCKCKEPYTPGGDELKHFISEYCEELRNTDGIQEGRERRLQGRLRPLPARLRLRQARVRPLQAQGLRRLRRLRLQGPRRPARADGGHRPGEEADPGARARGRALRAGALRRHAHPQDGRHGEGPAGHHRHEAGAGGLHQMTPGQAGAAPEAAAVPPAGLQRFVESHVLSKLEYLNAIGIALSRERDIDKLLETILVAAKKLTRADGGTLYRLLDDRLHFEIMRNDSLGIAMGGSSGSPVPFYPIPLHDKEGRPNLTMIAAYVALNDRTVNIADAYTEEGFDFSGTRNFDKRTGYRSTSFLTVPMKDHEGKIIGVLQLINAIDAATGQVTAFSEEDGRLAESLASQAAIALTNRLLIQQLEVLFESLIELINTAIDDKSPYTGGHCKRVPTLTMMLAEAASATREGPLASFQMTDKDRYELKIAGLLHDCGKITTPVHVVDKATKLQTIYDRMALVDTRFEALKREAEIAMLRARIAAIEAGDASSAERAREDFEAKVRQYDDDREFLRRTNVGGERMSAEDQARVSRIAQYSWTGTTRARRALPHQGRGGQPQHPGRDVEPAGTRDHQPPHRRHHQDARGPAVAAAPDERPGVRRRAPRAHGRQGLPEGAHARADERAGPHHGHRRHLRGAHRARPALQARQDAFRVARDPRPLQAERPHRPGPLRHLRARGPLPALRAGVPRSGADRRGGRGEDSRLRGLTKNVTTCAQARPGRAGLPDKGQVAGTPDGHREPGTGVSQVRK